MVLQKNKIVEAKLFSGSLVAWYLLVDSSDCDVLQISAREQDLLRIKHCLGIASMACCISCEH